MSNNRAIVVISTDCSPEMEQQFNDWYNNVHIPMALKYPGMLKASRYQLSSTNSQRKSYLTIFEFRDDKAMQAFPGSPEVAAAKEEMQQRWQDNLPFEIKSRAEYDLIHSWEK
jgi:antibiotic biosynthesis monooxygenase (ABM) superfamily enzyme